MCVFFQYYSTFEQVVLKESEIRIYFIVFVTAYKGFQDGNTSVSRTRPVFMSENKREREGVEGERESSERTGSKEERERAL